MQVGVVGYLGKMGQEILRCIDSSDHTCVYRKDETNELLQCTPECLIDFSVPEALSSSCEKAIFFQCPLVIGTTGLTSKHHEVIEDCAKQIPVFYSTNYSLGIHCVQTMLKAVSGQLKDWDIGIVETHHTEKKDAPSGTAYSLQKTLNRNVPIESFRLKGVPGEHEIVFSNYNEIIHLKHTAYSRQVFASGALDCAEWLVDNHFQSGLFDMNSRFEGQ